MCVTVGVWLSSRERESRMIACGHTKKKTPKQTWVLGSFKDIITHCYRGSMVFQFQSFSPPILLTYTNPSAVLLDSKLKVGWVDFFKSYRTLFSVCSDAPTSDRSTTAKCNRRASLQKISFIMGIIAIRLLDVRQARQPHNDCLCPTNRNTATSGTFRWPRTHRRCCLVYMGWNT